MVGRHAVLLQDLDPSLRPSDVWFDNVLIWIRILNLSFAWANERRGRKIVAMVGQVYKLGVNEFDDAVDSFLRARVAIPVDKPLRRGILIRLEKKKAGDWFKIQYEKLPFVCFSCGIMGHSELECSSPFDRDEQGNRPYDNSLWAPYFKKKGEFWTSCGGGMV